MDRNQKMNRTTITISNKIHEKLDESKLYDTMSYMGFIEESLDQYSGVEQ